MIQQDKTAVKLKMTRKTTFIQARCTMEKRYYSPKDIREITGISRAQVYNIMNRTDFPAVRIGKRIIVPIEAFNRWLDEQTQKRT